MGYRRALCLLVLALLSGCAALRRPVIAESIPPYSHYVAMGSSFAAGPGVDTIEIGTPLRCTRSVSNYAHQLAQQRNLRLTDVTCSGATTEHVLGPWRELPAQLDALRTDTRLVTLTIGGNDLGFMSGLIGATCLSRGLQARYPSSMCRPPAQPDQTTYDALKSRLHEIVLEVRGRSPDATLVFIDYATVLPARGRCEGAPLSDTDMKTLRLIDRRLRVLTEDTARQSGALLVKAGLLTRAHHVCASDPWVNGFIMDDKEKSSSIYHPTHAAMTEIAAALDRLLAR